MLRIPAVLIQQIIHHAMAMAPVEACGLIAGNHNLARLVYPMTNMDRSQEHFTMDPAEQLAVAKDMRARGLELLAIYHSHPSSPARLSAEDIRLAFTPGVSYLIVSLSEDRDPVIRAFRIEDGQVQEESIEVTDDTLQH